MSSKLKELVYIERAAKEIGMRRDRLKEICVRAKIAVRWGGTDERPRLKVRMEDVERVVMSLKEEAPDNVRPKQAFRGSLDPSVKC